MTPVTDIATLVDAFVVTVVFVEKPSALVASDALAGPVLLDLVSMSMDVIDSVQLGGGEMESV